MQQASVDGHPLAGPLALVVLAAAILALPVSLVLLRSYRRRIVAGMMARGSSEAVTGAVGAWRDGMATAGARPGRTEEPSVMDARASPAGGVYPVIRRRVKRLVGIYTAGGLGFALVMGLGWVSSGGEGIGFLQLMVVAWSFAWPALLSVVLVSAGSAGDLMRLSAGYFGIMALLGLIAVTVSDALTAGQLVGLWLILNGPPTLLIALFLSRPVRAVGPLVFAFFLVVGGGAVLAVTLMASNESIQRLLTEIAVALGLEDPVQLILGVVLLGVAALSPLGYAVGRRLGAWYDGKRISDQSITLDALWLTFAFEQSIVLVAAGGPVWLLSGLAAFVAYRGTIRLGFRTLERGPAGPAPRLLVLRAFALGRRSERLFSTVTKQWRHVGSVQLICGPDLATTTVEPHEFLDFLHGRISRRFIDGPAALERRMAERDLAPDPDGRFRINEFFCYDDVWRTVFAHLLAVSDAVLMDLRGFSRQSAGLAFEVGELVRSAPLQRVVLLVDRETDRTYLDEIAREAWEAREPRIRGGPPPLELVHAPDAGYYRPVLRALSGALLVG
jgi:hypothetical protein